MRKKRLDLASSRFNSIKNSPFLKSNKGQITPFIILGIMLLLVLVIIVVLKTEVVQFKPEQLLLPEKGKVENYLTACIDKLGNEALLLVGTQGGYVKVPEDIAQDSSQNLRVSPMNVVPYWASGPNKRVPSLQQIKADIDGYIQDNLRDCVENWGPFQNEYNIIEKGPMQVNTEIVENKVIFNVNWVLEIRNKAGEMVSEVSDHVAESPIKLKKAYDTATAIVDSELNYMKIEDITQDLIALENSGVPLSGIEMSCGQKKWKVSDVENKLKDMLRVNLAQLQIQGTDIIEYPEELPYYQNHYLWNLGENFTQSKISAQFQFDSSYPFSFEVSPRKGEYLVTDQANLGKVMSALCIQSWKFVYNVNYPVKAQILDETTGYTFNIAFMVHLNKNIPDRSQGAQPLKSIASRTISSFSSEEYCNERRIPMTISTYKLVENDHTGIFYRESLPEVNLTYSCLQYSCPSGMTEYNFAQSGDVASYFSTFPYCVGAIVKGNKANFKEGWTRVVSSPGQNVEINLTPILTIPANKIKIMKHKLIPVEKGLPIVSPGIELTANEYASVQITFDKLTGVPTANSMMYSSYYPNNHFHQSSVILSPNLNNLSGIENMNQLSNKLDFLAEADFTYNLEITVFNQNDEEGSLAGGYNYNWTLPWNEINNAKSITFHVLESENDNEEGLYDFMTSLNQNSLLLPKPEVVR